MIRDLQAGIDFLSKLELTDAELEALPAGPDYAILAELAKSRGFAVSAECVEQAFRVFMQARAVRSTLRAAGTGQG